MERKSMDAAKIGTEEQDKPTVLLKFGTMRMTMYLPPYGGTMIIEDSGETDSNDPEGVPIILSQAA